MCATMLTRWGGPAAVLDEVLWTLRPAVRGRLGRPRTWGFCATCVGAAAAGIGNLAEDWLGLGFVGLAIYLPGILFLTIGLLLLGVATVRAHLLPRWCGWALISDLLGLVPIEWGEGSRLASFGLRSAPSSPTVFGMESSPTTLQ